MAFFKVRVKTCCCGCCTLRTGLLIILWFDTIALFIYLTKWYDGFVPKTQKVDEFGDEIPIPMQLFTMMNALLGVSFSVTGIFAIYSNVTVLLLATYYYFLYMGVMLSIIIVTKLASVLVEPCSDDEPTKSGYISLENPCTLDIKPRLFAEVTGLILVIYFAVITISYYDFYWSQHEASDPVVNTINTDSQNIDEDPL